MKTIEYGGCLPREKWLKNKPNNIPSNTYFFNTGRSAIYAALVVNSKNKIVLPYYTCPTIKDFLIMHGIKVREYNIDHHFMPLLDDVEEDELLLFTDYYGCMNKKIIDWCIEKFGSKLILDNCQSFFGEPANCKYNVYSPRKFLGITCGGILLTSDLINHDSFEYWLVDNSSEDFLDISEEQGSNAAYAKYCENEEEFRKTHKKAPSSVIDVVLYADYSAIQKRRKHMFDRLHEAFGESEELYVDYKRGQTAYVFPMWTEDIDLRKRLVEQKVYCSTWWRRVMESSKTNSFEKSLVEHMIPIPIDHRYDDDEITNLIRIIKKQMKNEV